MESSGEGGGGRAVLAFFGLETRGKAVAALFWAAPYLLLLAVGLAGLSLAIQWLFPLPVWVHGLGLSLALGYFFLFLARVRRSAEAAEGGGPGRGAPPPGGTT